MTITSDQKQKYILSELTHIDNEIRRALSDETTSARIQGLLDLYHLTESSLHDPDVSPLTFAAIRFRCTYEISASRAAQGLAITECELGDMHDATLGLIYATNTTTLLAALDALSDFEG